jgi:hypothetical protein
MTLSELGSLCLCSYCLDARNRDRIRFPHSSVCCRQTNLIEKPLFQLGRRPIFTGSIPTVRAPICSRTTRATGTQARKSSRGSAALPFSAEFAGISLHPPGTLMVLRYGRRRFPVEITGMRVVLFRTAEKTETKRCTPPADRNRLHYPFSISQWQMRVLRSIVPLCDRCSTPGMTSRLTAP